MILVYNDPSSGELISSGCDSRTKIVSLLTKKVGKYAKDAEEIVQYVFIDRDGNTTHGQMDFSDV